MNLKRPRRKLVRMQVCVECHAQAAIYSVMSCRHTECVLGQGNDCLGPDTNKPVFCCSHACLDPLAYLGRIEGLLGLEERRNDRQLTCAKEGDARSRMRHALSLHPFAMLRNRGTCRMGYPRSAKNALVKFCHRLSTGARKLKDVANFEAPTLDGPRATT